MKTGGRACGSRPTLTIRFAKSLRATNVLAACGFLATVDAANFRELGLELALPAVVPRDRKCGGGEVMAEHSSKSKTGAPHRAGPRTSRSRPRVVRDRSHERETVRDERGQIQPANRKSALRLGVRKPPGA